MSPSLISSLSNSLNGFSASSNLLLHPTIGPVRLGFREGVVCYQRNHRLPESVGRTEDVSTKTSSFFTYLPYFKTLHVVRDR